MKEKDIVCESTNFHGVTVKGGVEIRLNGSTYSVAVGVKPSVADAEKIIARLEKCVGNVRKMYQLP